MYLYFHTPKHYIFVSNIKLSGIQKFANISMLFWVTLFKVIFRQVNFTCNIKKYDFHAQHEIIFIPGKTIFYVNTLRCLSSLALSMFLAKILTSVCVLLFLKRSYHCFNSYTKHHTYLQK